MSIAGDGTVEPFGTDLLAPGRARRPSAVAPAPRLRPVADPSPADEPGLGLGPVRRVAVLRALPGVGDMVCAVPALRALRRRFPDARIALVGLWSSRWMLDAYPDYVDELLPIDGLPMLCPPPIDVEGAMAALSEARRQQFDLAVQLHGDGSLSNLITTLVGARHNLVHHRPDSPAPAGALAVPYHDRGHEVVRLLELVDRLGIAGDAQLEPPDPSAQAGGTALVERLGLRPGGFAVIHPGASEPRRRWPVTGFAAVARWLHGQGLAVVATGTEPERPVVRELERLEAGVIDLCGQTGVCELAGVLSAARLVVSNDTGVAHLAAAVRAPSVVTFLGSDPGRWAPLDSTRHRIVMLTHGPGDRRPAGAEGLLPAELAAVLEAVSEQLGAFPG